MKVLSALQGAPPWHQNHQGSYDYLPLLLPIALHLDARERVNTRTRVVAVPGP